MRYKCVLSIVSFYFCGCTELYIFENDVVTFYFIYCWFYLLTIFWFKEFAHVVVKYMFRFSLLFSAHRCNLVSNKIRIYKKKKKSYEEMTWNFWKEITNTSEEKIGKEKNRQRCFGERQSTFLNNLNMVPGHFLYLCHFCDRISLIIRTEYAIHVGCMLSSAINYIQFNALTIQQLHCKTTSS